tara:strand:+ start:665 stop:910 length:246 start_codon:yes stop_codon:yes gene_type:complete
MLLNKIQLWQRILCDGRKWNICGIFVERSAKYSVNLGYKSIYKKVPFYGRTVGRAHKKSPSFEGLKRVEERSRTADLLNHN